MSDFTPVSQIPPAPGWLSDEGIVIYGRITQDRFQAGLLFAADIDLYSAYANEASNYNRLAQEIAAEGDIITDKNGDPRRNPKVLEKNKALENSLKLAKQLGIGVYSRDKITTEQQDNGGRFRPRLEDMLTIYSVIDREDNDYTFEEKRMLKAAVSDIEILDKERDFEHLRDQAAKYRMQLGFDSWSARHGEI